ncbi:MAG TPA: hypothetical protein PLF31_02475 [Candidatus Paceibacterota bacterium]|nr:hypothetical protein [Candidatus Paceibacterota bacterium]
MEVFEMESGTTKARVRIDMCECGAHGNLFLNDARCTTIISKRQVSLLVQSLVEDKILDEADMRAVLLPALTSNMMKASKADYPELDMKLLLDGKVLPDVGCFIPTEFAIPLHDLEGLDNEIEKAA